MAKRAAVEQSDDLDVLSAIWILSCNDPIALISYQGIKDRLLLSDEVDVGSLIRGRRELFRPVSDARLSEWQIDMGKGRNLPTWIASIGDAKERTKKINGLSSADFFRNQFRSSHKAPPCSLEIVDWGLQHLDRLRKASAESRAEKLQRKTALLLPVASMLLSAVVVIGSVAGGFFIQAQTSKSQLEIKRHEVSVKPKQESYANFMSLFGEAALAAFGADETKTLEYLNRMESAYFIMEPFLGEQRKTILSKFHEFFALCTKQAREPKIIGNGASNVNRDAYQAAVEKVAFYKRYFNETLHSLLFSGEPAKTL